MSQHLLDLEKYTEKITSYPRSILDISKYKELYNFIWLEALFSIIFRNHTIFYHLTLNTYISKIIGDPWPFLIRFILLCPQHHLGNSRHHVQLLDDRVHVTGGTTVLKTDEATPGTTINRGEVLKNWVKNEHFFATTPEISYNMILYSKWTWIQTQIHVHYAHQTYCVY